MFALALAGCYEEPDYSDTRFRCGEGGRCPSGYTCLLGVCERGSSIDGAMVQGILCNGTRCDVGDVCCVYLGTATCRPPGQGPCARTATCDASSATCGALEVCCQTPSGADCQSYVTCLGTYVCEGVDDVDCLDTCCPTSDGPWGVCGSC